MTLSSLARAYLASWSARCRGALRTAYTVEGEGVRLRADFLRFIERLMKKEDPMILKRTIETDHLTIYVFRKDAEEVSAVRAVAQVIVELGDDPEGVSNAAINFAIPGKPLSGGQRFREICQAYRRQWPGVMEVDRVTESHVYRNKRYFFNAPFLAWLRTNLDEIERVVYPVTSRIKNIDRENA